VGAGCGQGELPLLARRGGRDIKKISRSVHQKERTGWWFKIVLLFLHMFYDRAYRRIKDV
jgi:hypothetical protein